MKYNQCRHYYRTDVRAWCGFCCFSDAVSHLCREDGVIIYMTVLCLGLLHVGAASETQSRAGPH